MSLRNPAERWGIVSQAFHWIIVVLIVTMGWLGLTMTDLPTGVEKVRMYTLHKSIGLTILALAVLRLGWRLYAGRPVPLPQPAWQRRIADLTHAALYLLLVVIPLSGWVVNSSAGFPLRWWGVVRVPPIVAKGKALHDVAVEVHEWLFWMLVALALVHAAAAVWHHCFHHDATLARMLPRGWLRLPDQESPHA